MTDLSLKYSEIIKLEENEEEAKKKLLDISQKIYNLKKKTQENELQTVIVEKQLSQLKQDCHTLKIDSELQKNQIESLKLKVNQQIRVLETETSKLEGIQEAICGNIQEFIHKAKSGKETIEKNEAEKFIQKRDISIKMKETAEENLKQEGEIVALKLFTQFQQKQIKVVEQTLIIMKEANILKK